MRVVLYDVETTGLPLWDKPSNHPEQPHIVQYCSITFDSDTGEELDFYETLVRPRGWVVPEAMTKIHGISHDAALASGIDEVMVARQFYASAVKADRVSAFNVEFDNRIMRIAMKRNGIPTAALDEFSEMLKYKKHCLMLQARPICRLPPTMAMIKSGRKTWKSPSLKE